MYQGDFENGTEYWLHCDLKMDNRLITLSMVSILCLEKSKFPCDVVGASGDREDWR